MNIRFYFDYISSNAYLAWKVLPERAARYGARVEPVPVLFAGFLEALGQLGPAEIPVKAVWMMKNNLRKATLLGLPLNPPAHHPFNPLLALRASAVPTDAAERAALVDALFDAVWVHGLHVSEPEVVASVAAGAGLDGERIVAEARSSAAKTRLREASDAAVARGVFGVPTFEVEGELFWGYDDLPFAELRMAGKDPLDAAAAQSWIGAFTPSARRRRFRD